MATTQTHHQPTQPIALTEGSPDRGILDRAVQGDMTALPELRALLDRDPEAWRIFGDLARRAEQDAITLHAGEDLFTRESMTRQLAELRAELEGESPSPLERLLCRRVTLDWLQVHLADSIAMCRSPAAKNYPANAEFREKLRDQAHRRYLRSVKALAELRRLVRPALSPLDVSRMTVGGRAAESPIPRCSSGPRRPKAEPARAG